jgi:hypothetical protein
MKHFCCNNEICKITTHFETALVARMKWGAGSTSDTVKERSKHEYFHLHLALLKHAYLACGRVFISGIHVLKQTHFNPFSLFCIVTTCDIITSVSSFVLMCQLYLTECKPSIERP